MSHADARGESPAVMGGTGCEHNPMGDAMQGTYTPAASMQQTTAIGVMNSICCREKKVSRRCVLYRAMTDPGEDPSDLSLPESGLGVAAGRPTTGHGPSETGLLETSVDTS